MLNGGHVKHTGTRVLEPAEYPGLWSPPKPAGFQVKSEPVTGFARLGCTHRVPGFRSSGVHLYYPYEAKISVCNGIQLYVCTCAQQL